MAEQKISAALRPLQALRRSTTHSGVTHVRTYQSGQYVIVGNHLAQHRQLSLTAIGLATHMMSVPEGTPVDIRSLAERFPEGRDRIAAALRELEAHGYLERVREHTGAGRLITRTYVHHVPVDDAAAAAAVPLRVAVRPAAGGRRAERQAAGTEANPPAAPEEDDPSPCSQLSPSEPEEPVPVASPPAPAPSEPAALPPAPTAAPAPSTAAAPQTPQAVPATSAEAEPPPQPPHEQAPRDRRYDKAVALLAGLRRADERLILSRRDVERLVPAVTAWFDSGATTAVIQQALTGGLPVDLRNPAKLIAYRLAELLPMPLPARPAPPSDGAVPGQVPRRPDPFQTCDGCERAFRAPHPGMCRDCRAERAARGGAACAA
ncbi:MULTISPECIES: helix-turn-helix domain-containing protein [Streptomyces]|uniref:helix-turn-helix domain-containing protein n=1 Tax=Streptomyces TaxID=1883 RepID=UPI00203C69EB|nr:helix-turn-helix domain-containing protein [Streptomyces thermoviolaceus]MCM3263503.1 helix-turn-helix domain-containing protein [Streptomyces thermoviolaceus]WTD48065.1 helix-turn-helix domain-containing protein [Streptomyces thermoviolaceus]